MLIAARIIIGLLTIFLFGRYGLKEEKWEVQDEKLAAVIFHLVILESILILLNFDSTAMLILLLFLAGLTVLARQEDQKIGLIQIYFIMIGSVAFLICISNQNVLLI